MRNIITTRLHCRISGRWSLLRFRAPYLPALSEVDREAEGRLIEPVSGILD